MSLPGIEDYASDSEDENGPQVEQPGPASTPPGPSAGPSGVKRGLGLNLPPPRTNKRKGPVVITVEKPKRPVEEVEEPQDRDKKRLRVGPNGTSHSNSSLLAMLPPPSKQPKEKPPPPKRMLGGAVAEGGSVGIDLTGGSAGSRRSRSPTPADQGDKQVAQLPVKAKDRVIHVDTIQPWELEYEPDPEEESVVNEDEADMSEESLLRKKWEKQWEQGSELNEYGLGEAYLIRREIPKIPNPNKAAAGPAAPPLPPVVVPPELLDEWANFQPPVPQRDDPYPGFFRHPSGTWEQHNRDYYMKCYARWLDPEAPDPGLPPKEVVMRGFEEADASAVDVDARKQREEAEMERKKKESQRAAQGEKTAPRMNLTAAKTNSVARSRHQLSTMLSEAYSNREAYEEQIAAGKRNRREAGRKYGF